MPAVSKKQQRFFGYLLSNPEERKKKGISKKAAKDFAQDVKEVAPPGWGHTKAEKEKTKPDKPKSKIGGTAAAFKRALDDGRFKGLPGSKTKKEKTADMFKLMWSMKKKGDKPHYKPGTDKKYKKYQEEGTSMPYVSTNDKKAINKRAKNLFKKDLKGTHDGVNEAAGGGVPLSPQELEIQKKMARLNVRLARKRSQALSQAKTKDTETAPEQVKEGSLRKWFKGSKSKDGKGGWVNVVTGGTCASDEPGEGTPKCVSSAKRASMTKAERLSASRRKKAADPGQQQKTGAAKPTYVRTDSKKKMKEETSMQDNNLFGNAFAYEKLKKKIGSKKKHDKPAMESVITMIGRKKKEKTASKAMDAGAKARRAMKRREHAKYVSGSTENVPRELEDQVQYEEKVLKTIAKELDGASKMHKGQAKKIRKHIKDMRKEAVDMKLETKKNCGCGQDPCITFGKKKLTQAQKVDEALVEPKDGVDSAKEVRKATRKAAFRPFNKEDYYAGTGEKVVARTKKYMDKKGMKGAPGLDAMKARTAEHKAKRGVKEDARLAMYQSGMTDASRVKGPVGKAVDKVKSTFKKKKRLDPLDRYRFQSGMTKEEVVNEEDKAFNYVVAKLKAKHGDGVLTTGEKMKPQSAANKAKARAYQAQS